ncbi:hypothetical protein HY385_00235 [Candidatus Daviesbacteria bacterium]|nr:hypothetical protein [Candidatus Daviesbacteria bacterium]
MANKMSGWTILVIALLAYAFVPPVQNFVNGIFGGLGGGAGTGGGAVGTGGTSGGAADTGGVITICDPSAKVTLAVDSWDKFAASSEITNGSHRVFIDGVDKGYLAEGGTITVSPKQKYRIILGENSTSHYSKEILGEVPCTGTVNVAGGLAAYDNSLTFTVFNEDGQTIQQATGETDTIDLSANSVFTLPFKITVTSKQSFGNPDHPGKGDVVCFAYNKSQYDEIKVDGATGAPSPNQISTGSSNETACWYIPVIQNSPDVLDGTKVSDSIVDGKYEGNIIIDTSASYSDPGATQGNLTLSAIDTDLDLNGDTLASIYSFQDESNNDLGSVVEQIEGFQRS